MSWYNIIKTDNSKLIEAIQYFEEQYAEARKEVILKGGGLERTASDLPALTEYRYSQLQDIEAILEIFNIELRKVKSQKYIHYSEHYKKALTTKDIERYIDSEPEIIGLCNITNEIALIRNKYLGLFKGFDSKQWMISNIVKLRVAGLEDITI